MGERYFNISTAIRIGSILAILPLIPGIGSVLAALNFSKIYVPEPDDSKFSFIKEHYLWYVFLTAYFFQSYYRHEEIQRLPSVFDFERYSKSDGVISEIFTDLKYEGKPFSIRTIEIWLEPIPFLLLGIIAIFIKQQGFGLLMILCAIVYSMSKSAQYYMGDQSVMDTIDSLLVNRDFADTFIREKATESGFYFKGKRPNTIEDRESLLNNHLDEDGFSEVS